MNVRLSNSIKELKDRYGTIVIGSGYGGSITAARLSAAGFDVCLLEKGKEWIPGQFPDELDEVVTNIRSKIKPLGLYEYHVTDDVDVFVGSGLGGTSLINANVLFKPEGDVFDNMKWPDEIRKERDSGQLDEYYDKVNHMLQGTIYPDESPTLRKTTFHESSSKERSGHFYKLNLAVNVKKYDNEPNHVGVDQRVCTLCGDCMTGCNVTAKNTLYMNYIPFSKKHGASIFTEMEVNFITKAKGGGYFVHCKSHSENGVDRILHSNNVILSAGSLGSTRILLNSRDRGLSISDRIGHSFSGNGDSFGVGYNNDHRTDTLGFGNFHDNRSKINVGPLITSVIDYRGKHLEIKDRFIIEEGDFPRAFVDFARYAMPKIAAVAGRDTDFTIIDELSESARVIKDIAHYNVNGALNHSMLYLGIGHDSSDGVIAIDSTGNIRIHWESAPSLPIFKKIDEEMEGLVKALGGTYIKNPRWTSFFGRNIVTVHPLGGCPMGENVETGVVDHRGRVFDPSSTEASNGIHNGLFVADGSMIPTSLGVNPLFNISALSERVADLIIHDNAILKGPKDDTLPLPIDSVPPVGLEFTEEMNGHFSESVTDATTPEEYKKAEDLGKDEGNSLGFKLTMYIDSVDKFVNEPAHIARAEGHIKWGTSKFMVERGRFNLFFKDIENHTKRMLYSVQFSDQNGDAYLLDGYKEVRDDPESDVLEIWKDNTTLFSTIYKGTSTEAPIFGQGIVRICLDDIIKQISTIRVRNTPDIKTGVIAKSRFMSFFFGELWETYIKQLPIQEDDK